MIEYRIRVYGPDGKLHWTKKFFADDDAAAKAEAQTLYNDDVTKRKSQQAPPIAEPELGGYRLYRLIHDGKAP